jgi:hypothetical protein
MNPVHGSTVSTRRASLHLCPLFTSLLRLTLEMDVTYCKLCSFAHPLNLFGVPRDSASSALCGSVKYNPVSEARVLVYAAYWQGPSPQRYNSKSCPATAMQAIKGRGYRCYSYLTSAVTPTTSFVSGELQVVPKYYPRVLSPTETKDFPLASVYRPALRPTQTPIQWAPVVLSLEVKRGRAVTLTSHPI